MISKMEKKKDFLPEENEQYAIRYDDYIQQQANPSAIWPAHCQHLETFISDGRVACKKCGAFMPQ